jgi:uncharacterized protein YjbI with pentapeptide repeats
VMRMAGLCVVGTMDATLTTPWTGGLRRDGCRFASYRLQVANLQPANLQLAYLQLANLPHPTRR